jgi:2-polyprenyl-3-methyl-5-hydroxy-6-metoxy-1,4-benzoquinol methylase
MSTVDTVPDTAPAELLAERLFDAANAAMDLFSVYLGDRLGYYRDLAQNGPASSVMLAERTGTAERYAREWLEQQAVTGILMVEDAGAAPMERLYRMPEGYEAVLADPASPLAMAPVAQILAGCVKPLPALLEAYRTGGGVPYEDYGADLAEGQAGTTYPQFLHLLAQEWIPAMPDVHERLQDASRPARVADVGMGLGWSSITLARAYPAIHVDGFDLDEASVAAARANGEAEGLSDRVTFHAIDAGDAEPPGGYDFALAVECIHDMSNPVGVLQSLRRLVDDGGAVLVVDEKVAETFQTPGDDVERYMYGFSILHCLPVGMVEQPSAATGTVMRVDTLREYATQAGFQRVDLLPIEHDFFRFYRLTA